MVGSRDVPLPDGEQLRKDLRSCAAQIGAALGLVDAVHRSSLEGVLTSTVQWAPGHSVEWAFNRAVEDAGRVEGEADQRGSIPAAFVAHAAVEAAGAASAAAMMENARGGGARMATWDNFRRAQTALGMAHASVVVARLLSANVRVDLPSGGWATVLRRYDYPSREALAFARELAASLGLPRPWRLGKVHPRLVGPLLAWVSKGALPVGVLPDLSHPVQGDAELEDYGDGLEHVDNDGDEEDDDLEGDDEAGSNEATEDRMDELATVLACRIRSEESRAIGNVEILVTANDIQLGDVRGPERQQLQVRWGMRLLYPEVSELADLVSRSFDVSFTDRGAYCFPHDKEDALARLLADRIRANSPVTVYSVDVLVTPTELQVRSVQDDSYSDIQIDWGIRLLLPEAQELASLVGSSFTILLEDDGTALCLPAVGLEACNRGGPVDARAYATDGGRANRSTDHDGADDAKIEEAEEGGRIDVLIQQLAQRIRALGPETIATVIITSTGRESWVSGVWSHVATRDGEDEHDIEDVEVDWSIKDLRPMVTELLALIGGSFAMHLHPDGTATKGIVL